MAGKKQKDEEVSEVVETETVSSGGDADFVFVTPEPSTDTVTVASPTFTPILVEPDPEPEDPAAADFKARLAAVPEAEWPRVVDDDLHRFRMLTDGVTWEMVDDRRSYLERLVAEVAGSED